MNPYPGSPSSSTSHALASAATSGRLGQKVEAVAKSPHSGRALRDAYTAPSGLVRQNEKLGGFAASSVVRIWWSLRAVIALIFIFAAAPALHAQNTHSAQLIRAQQQYFTVADSPSLNFGNGSMTAEAWVKVNAGAADSQDMVILEKRVSGDAAYMLYVANGGLLYAEAGQGLSADAAKTTQQIDDGMWHHVAMTYDQSTLRLYLDGALSDSKSVSGKDLGSTGQLAIGRSAISNSLFLDGFIDEVRIWNFARAEAQIQAEMTSKPTGTEPGLKAYWSFDNTLADATPNANTLTAFNSPAFTTATLPFTTPNNAFTDSFNRPDSTTVGNGWLTMAGSASPMEIRSNVLGYFGSSGLSGVYRPYASTGDVSVDVSLLEQSSSANRPDRFEHYVLIKNDGSINSGYGLVVSRTDSNVNNSKLYRWENGTLLDSVTPPFQWDSSVRLAAVFKSDGSVNGQALNSTGEILNFSFGTRTVQGSGSNAGLFVGGSASSPNPRFDDYTLSVKAYAVSGIVTAPVGTVDAVYALLDRPGQIYTMIVAANGTFSFPSVIAGDYTLSGFIDSNGNGTRDTGEPVGNYASNPIVVNADVTGLTVAIPVTPPVGSGLVGWWKFDEAEGLSAADSSEYGHHGVVTNATFEQIDGRRALRFTGNGSYVVVPHHADLAPQSLTMMTWVRYTNNSARTTNSGLISKQDSYRLWSISGVARGQVTGAGDIGASAPAAAEWHHLAFTADAAGRKLYRDGVLVDVGGGATVPATTADLILGSAHTNEEFFNGHFSEVRIYNRALSQEEVQGVMTPASLSGTVAYSGRIAGKLLAQASAGGGRSVVKAGSNGSFLFSGMLSGFAYSVSAFVDMNGNGAWENWEPRGQATGNPITAIGDVTGINITVSDAPDTDTDGIADAYETANGLTVGVNDALLDLDGDGLSNLREFLAGLKANAGDSDGDTTSDAIELQQNGTFAYSNDSDGDGMTDAFELANNLNPYSAADAALDYDGDGLTNLEEFTAGLNPRQRDTNTDGTSDYAQMKGGKFNRYYYDRTNRLTGAVYDNGTWMGWKYDGNSNIARQVVFTGFDADNDGLPDVWELQNGLSFASGTGSNGGNADNDNDGWTNYQEYLAGTNPNNATSVPTVPTSSASYQSAPLVRIIMPPDSGGAHAKLKVCVWDNESNPAALTLQYFHATSSEWRTATLLKLDNQNISPTSKATSSAAGITHDLLWNALTDLGPTQNGIVYLRVQGTDFNAGALSETTPFIVNATGDFDGDGMPDAWEIAHGLDPNDSIGSNGANADTDKDGLGNFGEFVFGLNINAADAKDAAITSTAINPADGKRYLTLTYRRRLDAAANGLTYSVQTSTDLINWTTNSPDIELISTTASGDGITELVTVRIKPPLDDPGVKKFARVLVTR